MNNLKQAYAVVLFIISCAVMIFCIYAIITNQPELCYIVMFVPASLAWVWVMVLIYEGVSGEE